MISKLGKPDKSDGAMGSSLMIWNSDDAQNERTAVFAGLSMGDATDKLVKRIMVSASEYQTKDGIATGATLSEIQENYKLEKVDDATAKDQGIVVYDDSKKGITFDIDDAINTCVAITVHKAGESPQSYINMHQE